MITLELELANAIRAWADLGNVLNPNGAASAEVMAEAQNRIDRAQAALSEARKTEQVAA